MVINNSDTLGRAIYIRKIDSIGNTLWLKPLDVDSNKHLMMGGNCFISTNDGNYLAVGGKSKDFQGNDMDMIAIKFNIDGEILWKHTYGSNNYEEAYGVLQTSDSGYYIYGYQYTDTTTSTFYCLKTDAVGNELWHKTYSLDGSSVPFSAHELSNGDYMISGYGYHATKDYEMYVVRTDAQGTQIWEKNYGSDFGDGAVKIVPFTENTFLCEGGTSYGFFPSTAIYKLFIGEINLNGTMLWSKEYQKTQLLSMQGGVKVLPDNTFVTAGDYGDLPEANTGILMKFTASGDTLWTRSYETSPTNDDYFRDIELCADGGFVMSGFDYTNQSSWVVKTDSLGNTCHALGCDSTYTVVIDTSTAVNTVEKPIFSASCSPNPAKNETTLHYNLPTHFPIAHFRLYNLRGETVLQQELATFKQEQSLHLQGISAGLYVFDIYFMGRKMAAGKLVVK